MEEFFNFIENPRLRPHFESWDTNPLNLPFEIKSRDYLGYAEQDLKEGSENSLVNSVGNIKRAIDCRIEEILFLFGLLNISRKEDWNFNKKTELLINVGVVAPRILNKINKKRNEIEHEFKRPQLGEIEDFFDITNLFLLYTSRYINHKYYEVCIGWNEEDFEDGEYIKYPYASMELHSEISKLVIRYFPSKETEKKFEVMLSSKENYLKLLKIWVKAANNLI